MQFEFDPRQRDFRVRLNGETQREKTSIIGCLSILMYGEPNHIKTEDEELIIGRLAKNTHLADVRFLIEDAMEGLPIEDRSTTEPFDYQILK